MRYCISIILPLLLIRSCSALGWGHIRILYKAPTDYTKPQKTRQSPNRQYKAPTDNTKPQQTIQSPDRLYKAPTDYTKT